MKLRIVEVEEPILIEDPIALRVWQKSLWLKGKAYRSSYTSGAMPLGVDDFVATQIIVAEELPNGEIEPITCYKMIKRSTAEKYKLKFGFESLVEKTNHKGSKEVCKLLDTSCDIAYLSSWGRNLNYSLTSEQNKLLRDYTTAAVINHQIEGGYKILTSGVKRFKIDDYFSWLGWGEILSEFSLDIIDGDIVRSFYSPGFESTSVAAGKRALKYKEAYESRLVFSPHEHIEEIPRKSAA